MSTSVLSVNIIYSYAIAGIGFMLSRFLTNGVDALNNPVEVLIESGGVAAVIAILYYIAKYQTKRLQEKDAQLEKIRVEQVADLRRQLVERDERIKELESGTNGHH